MTTTEIDTTTTHVPASRQADHIGQATAVEQARAVAEVQGAIVVAQQVPRDLDRAIRDMRDSCAQQGLADRAFFRYNRGGGQISGPAVHLARELARCWGNMQYGIAELRRDDAKGESEMLAFAWDVQTNTRATSTFIVKHLRDTKDGAKALTDQRDVYENNANNGARRLREQIFAILPAWFTAEAVDRCNATLKNGGGKPLATRVADIIKAFEDLGVIRDQVETKLGRPSSKWTDQDLATLRVVGGSINRGETTVEDEFPDMRVTAEEITRATNGRRKPAAVPPANVPDGDGPTAEDIAAMNAEADSATVEDVPASGFFGAE